MRVLKNPEDRKNEILDAAELLFVKKGYSKTTINDILQEIGIAKGTFYYYFKSKEEVMDAVIMRFVNKGIDTIQSIANDPNLNALEKLKIIMTIDNSNIDHKEEIIDELHKSNDGEMHMKSIVASINSLAPIITEIIKQGNKEGIFKTTYPKETVEFLLISSQIIFDEGIFQWSLKELVEKAKGLAHIMEITLGAPKGSFDYLPETYIKLLNKKEEL